MAEEDMKASEEGSPLLTLPPETFLHLLTFAGPFATSKLSETCKTLRAFCTSPPVSKALFLSLFDAPPTQEIYTYDYAATLRSRCRALKWLPKHNLLKTKGHEQDLEDTAEALVGIASSRPPRPMPSANQDFLEEVLPEVLCYVLACPPAGILRSKSLLQAIDYQISHTSRLHLLHTPTKAYVGSKSSRTHAREIVYDANNFSRASLWGPFRDRHANVDWKKLEALAVVMAANLRECDEEWGPAPPQGWDTTRPGEIPEDAGRDWAGVESQSFVGTYCFIDYRVFEHYNFHRTRSFAPSLDGETEAVGDCMKITLKLVPEGQSPPRGAPSPPDSEDEADDDSDDDSCDADYLHESTSLNPSASSSATADATSASSLSSASASSSSQLDRHPPLSFTGKSKPLHFIGTFASPSPVPNRSIAGNVSMTPDGQVHWSYTISYGGGPQWLMHGVQIGGVRSKYGIVGTWSTADHDAAGPNGPFRYWPEE